MTRHTAIPITAALLLVALPLVGARAQRAPVLPLAPTSVLGASAVIRPSVAPAPTPRLRMTADGEIESEAGGRAALPGEMLILWDSTGAGAEAPPLLPGAQLRAARAASAQLAHRGVLAAHPVVPFLESLTGNLRGDAEQTVPGRMPGRHAVVLILRADPTS